VAASIAHFVWFEVGNLIETSSRVGLIATSWPWAVIAVLRMETVIYVAMEVGRAVKILRHSNVATTQNHYIRTASPHAMAAMKQFSALLCPTCPPDGDIKVKGSVQ
jgi:hypothetical protein